MSSRRFPNEGIRRVERDPRPAYGSAPVVRAYLPRTHAVPMYNEPSAR